MFRDSRSTDGKSARILASVTDADADLNAPRFSTNQVLQIMTSDGSSISSWDNNLTGDSAIPYSGTYLNDNFLIGHQPASLTQLDGFIQEIIIRAEDDLTINREAIRDNINLRYTIY